MLYLLTTLALLGHRFHHSLTDRYQRARAADRDPEEGAITLEQVMWVGIAIGFVTLVAGAIRTYLDAQVGKIQ
ncbi:hypothetical protein [Antribacter gilvus]|uniref:hypothetical protein n=1 Tax=Antribacter gilvus TaxID=2304675 RepID=UPI000F7AA072|nr:hypothetical protein [Antribacter gilvus]